MDLMDSVMNWIPLEYGDLQGEQMNRRVTYINGKPIEIKNGGMATEAPP